MNNDLPEAC